MEFVYEGNNPIINYTLVPVAPAFSLFTINDEVKNCMVAFSEGTYHTIASTIEFGELLDGESPSTKADLMQKILNWFDGLITETSETLIIPGNKSLSCSPNPFRDETKITIHVEKQTPVSFNIYNIHGKKIKTLANQKNIPATFDLTWDGSDDRGNKVTAGIYYGVADFGSKTETIKLIITK